MKKTTYANIESILHANTKKLSNALCDVLVDWYVDLYTARRMRDRETLKELIPIKMRVAYLFRKVTMTLNYKSLELVAHYFKGFPGSINATNPAACAYWNSLIGSRVKQKDLLPYSDELAHKAQVPAIQLLYDYVKKSVDQFRQYYPTLFKDFPTDSFTAVTRLTTTERDLIEQAYHMFRYFRLAMVATTDYTLYHAFVEKSLIGLIAAFKLNDVMFSVRVFKNALIEYDDVGKMFVPLYPLNNRGNARLCDPVTNLCRETGVDSVVNPLNDICSTTDADAAKFNEPNGKVWLLDVATSLICSLQELYFDKWVNSDICGPVVFYVSRLTYLREALRLRGMKFHIRELLQLVEALDEVTMHVQTVKDGVALTATHALIEGMVRGVSVHRSTVRCADDEETVKELTKEIINEMIEMRRAELISMFSQRPVKQPEGVVDDALTYIADRSNTGRLWRLRELTTIATVMAEWNGEDFDLNSDRWGKLKAAFTSLNHGDMMEKTDGLDIVYEVS